MQYGRPTWRSNKFLLGWFVLASALVHLLFITLADNKAEQTVYVNLSAPLQITVVSSRSAARTLPQTTPQKPEPVTKTIPTLKRPSVQVAKATLPEKNHVNDPDNRSKTKRITEVAKTVREPVSIKNVPLNHLRQRLKQAIRARFTYPRIARRMGWEGLVGISLHIEDDGSLNQVQIARSSGHKILDENARKTIEGIGRIQVASNLAIQASDTEIEVLYRLTD
ncbi:MAG: energy transducer TonB [Gammaproteobacteria bacterium]|nr:energy transducer TonB [Gammaproteobacteria bacterium]